MPLNANNSDKVPNVVQVLATLDDRGNPAQATRELLGDAAQLAKRLNGGVTAWILQSSTDSLSDKVRRELAAHGCGTVCCLTNERFANWSSETVAAALAMHVGEDCRAILLPGNSRGEEAAALLAERLQSAWIPDVLTMAVTRQGTIEVTAVEPGGRLSRTYRSTGDRPAVLTIRPGVAEARRLDDNNDLTSSTCPLREVEVDLSGIPELTSTGGHFPADAATVDITWAERIVAAGRGAGGPDGMELVANLARDLDASPAASRMVVDLGWAAPERQVGQTGKTVRPDLYIACGISGASHHLAGMRDSKHVIAINTDADAPIHDIAHLSLCGDLHAVVPAIRKRLTRRRRPDEDTTDEPAG